MQRLGIKGVLLLVVGFTVIGLSVLSCNSNEDGSADKENAQQDSTQVYGLSDLKLPKFNAAATPIVNDWSIFDDFERELVEMNTLSLAEMRSRSQRLISFSDSLAKTIPDTLAVQSIVSRVGVLNTRVLLLEQSINSERPKYQLINGRFEELNTAHANLKVRINEKLLKDKINLDRRESEAAEREKQKAVLDSIAAAQGDG